jgi:FkbM family methyltransferase
VLIVRKTKTAISILRENGIGALFREVLNDLFSKKTPHRPNEARLAFKVLRADELTGIMVDVGAHFGESLAPFANNGWQIFAFEPDSENRKRLNVAFGELPNVRIDPRALSDHVKNGVVFYRSEESSGISGLSAFHPSHKEHDKVDVTSLECFIDEQRITNQTIDFLKIDTEGFDLLVLKGLPLDKYSPRLILCEFEDKKTLPIGYSFHDMAQFIQSRGYKLIISEWYPIKKYGGPHDWRRFTSYPCELVEDNAWGNILAVKEPHLYDSLLNICKI